MQYHWKNAGIGQELLTFSFSLSRVVQVRIHLSRSAVSCMLSSGLACLIQYSMVHLALVKLVMKVQMFGLFLLGTREEGSSGLWDLDVFEVVECGIGWRLPPDAIMEGDLIVQVTFVKFKEGACNAVHC